MVGWLTAIFAALVLANWIGFIGSAVLIAADFSLLRGLAFILHGIISVALFLLMMRALDSTIDS